MRSFSLYLGAALLVLASVPIYRYIIHRALQADSVASAPVVQSQRLDVDEVRSPVRPSSLTSNELRALEALAAGRAKCVNGVVYRTSDHVIEPWPGGVACVSDLDNSFSGVVPRGV